MSWSWPQPRSQWKTVKTKPEVSLKRKWMLTNYKSMTQSSNITIKCHSTLLITDISRKFIFASFLQVCFSFVGLMLSAQLSVWSLCKTSRRFRFPQSTFTPIISHTHTKTHMVAHSLPLTLIHIRTHSHSHQPQRWVTAPQQNNVSSVAMEISRYVTGMEYELVGSQWQTFQHRRAIRSVEENKTHKWGHIFDILYIHFMHNCFKKKIQCVKRHKKNPNWLYMRALDGNS